MNGEISNTFITNNTDNVLRFYGNISSVTTISICSSDSSNIANISIRNMCTSFNIYGLYTHSNIYSSNFKSSSSSKIVIL